MTLQQLRYLCAIVDNGYSLARAAGQVHTSQPGISSQIRLLERELGIELLWRAKGRIAGLTNAGEGVHTVAQRMLRDAANLKHIALDHTDREHGNFAIGMTHTHARYGMRDVIARFRKRYPDVQLVLRQGYPAQIFDYVSAGQVDVGVASDLLRSSSRVFTLACRASPLQMQGRAILVPARHPLLKVKNPSIAEIGKYPIVTLDPQMSGGRAVEQKFEEAGVEPHIVMRAADADVIKSYVELGIGIGIVPAIAFNARRDKTLRSIPANHLFGNGRLVVAFQPRAHLREYMLEFIRMVAPEWTASKLRTRLRGETTAD
jgi:LysR family cys regulon transcriptional activator